MLLREPRRGWTTADYLYVRLRARRAKLEEGRHPALAVAAPLWTAWRSELAWLYDRLPRDLRGPLQAVFDLEEQQQLLLALRALAAGDREALTRICRGSLLASEIRQGLLGAADLHGALAGLASRPGPVGSWFAGAWQHYLSEGPGGLEQLLHGRVLQAGARGGRLPVVRAYFRYLIDMRNLLGTFKHLRWQVAQPPTWLPGGELGIAPLREAWQRQDAQRLAVLVRRRVGRSWPAAGDPEEHLWQGLGAELRRCGRDPLHPAQLLDYLVRWRLRLRSEALA